MIDLPELLVYLAAFATAVAGALLVTPVVRDVARRIGFVDRPDGGRKTHKQSVALGGGFAVFVSTLLALLVGYGLASNLGMDLWDGAADASIQIGILLAAALTVALGLLDDSVTLLGRYKLLGQVLIAGLLVAFGLRVDSFMIFGGEVSLGVLAIPFTIFWLLGTINAINLIDGIDGLASSVGVVLCLTVAAINAIYGHFAESVVLVALAGVLLGFLRYNSAPASIYLGDAGSMLIGLLIGAIAVHTSVKSSAAFAMAVPVAVWSIPIFDSAAAILRRKLTGRSLFAADRGHLHHSLLVHGWSVRQASLFIALICAFTCIGAVLSVVFENELYALLSVVAVVGFLVCTKTFGHIEFALVRNRFRNSALPINPKKEARYREHSLQLQGAREWDKLWSAIVEAADGYRLLKVRLTINMPAIHESFFASWESSRPSAAESQHAWRLSHPLVLDGVTVGQLDLSGLTDPGAGDSSFSQIVHVLEFLEPLEEDIRRIREGIALDSSAAVATDSAEPYALGRAKNKNPSAFPPTSSQNAAAGLVN